MSFQTGLRKAGLKKMLNTMKRQRPYFVVLAKSIFLLSHIGAAKAEKQGVFVQQMPSRGDVCKGER